MLLAGSDPELERRATQRGLQVRHVTFTPFDSAAAAKVRHFETYNRTAAAQRVADIVTAAQAAPGAILVANGDAAWPACSPAR